MMNSYAITIVAIAFTPPAICIGAAIGLAMNDREYAGFGWMGFFLGGGALILAGQVIAMGAP